MLYDYNFIKTGKQNVSSKEGLDMLLTKKQFLSLANQTFSEYLKNIPAKEKLRLNRKFKLWPPVRDVYVLHCDFEGEDVSKMEIQLTLEIDGNEKKQPNYNCVCALQNNIAICAINRAPQYLAIYIRHFINYFFYEILLKDNEINPNEWNNWDKIRERTLKEFEKLK